LSWFAASEIKPLCLLLEKLAVLHASRLKLVAVLLLLFLEIIALIA
jgi:hypothetical protein